MPIFSKCFRFFGAAILLPLLVFGLAENAKAQSGKLPVIVIPGLVGSELKNPTTKEVVWFKIARSKTDDLRLPLSANLAENRDNLVPFDILRSTKIGLFPKQDVYQGLLNALAAKGGYRESDWDNPAATDYEDSFYIFAYDWRRDNVENARLLIRKIENLKRRLNRPDLKFNVVAHSMGGLIARYAAMYGDADLPVDSAASPTWAGAGNFDKIFMLGTPNEGSTLALKSLLSGFAFGKININLPFVQNLSEFDLFTVPSVYQLLPTSESLRLYDENLKPLKIDLYNPKTWTDYDWSIINSKNFSRQYNADDRRNAQSYFAAALNRAKKFHAALDASSNAPMPIKMFAFGGDCQETLNAAVIYRNGSGWKTQFTATAFRRDDGKTVSAADLNRVLFAKGDGIVSKSSLLGSTPAISTDSQFFRCEGHNKLVANSDIQNRVINLLVKK